MFLIVEMGSSLLEVWFLLYMLVLVREGKLVLLLERLEWDDKEFEEDDCFGLVCKFRIEVGFCSVIGFFCFI